MVTQDVLASVVAHAKEAFNAIEMWRHWTFIMQGAIILAVGIICFYVRTTEIYERLVHREHGWASRVQLWGNVSLAVSLCWVIVYGWENGWQPWPPMTVSICILDVILISRASIMYADLKAALREHGITMDQAIGLRKGAPVVQR